MNVRAGLACIVGVIALFLLKSTALAAGPLKEAALTALVEAGFEDEEIVSKVEKDGLAFQADADSLERLKSAGASDAVLKAVAAAKSAVVPSPNAEPLIAFEKIVALLESGVDSDLIVARLRKSAATYTLSAEQEQQLRDLGATDDLIVAMKSGAKDVSTPEPISDLALVLDVSASMNEPTADGRAKIDVAKEVVGELVQSIPEGLNLTVVVYGHAPGCSAVKVLRSLSELKSGDRESLAQEINSLNAVGNTPIALALKQAGEQFTGRKTYCGVVLITDGLESCNGDPSAEAARLAENPMLRFGVNVVGFGLKPAESAATAEIAAQGKGKYYPATDPAELLSAIQDMAKKIKRGVKPAPVNPATPTGKRAVVVLAPEVQMPALKEIVTVSDKASYYTVDSYRINQVSDYGAELRQPSADAVDIWFIPEAGIPVLMVEQFENPERQIKTLRPEDYLGMVRVQAEGAADVTVVVTTLETSAGTIDSYKVQEITGYNQDMVVPVGTYMLWVVEKGKEPVLLEEELQVAGGKVTAAEN